MTWADDPAGYLLQNRTLWIVLAAAALCFFIVTRGTARGRSVSVFPYYYGLGGLWLLVLLRLAISTAGGIAREKESGAWPVLLMTPLSEMQILWRKAVTALRRNAVLLLALLAIQTCLMLRSGVPRGVWIAAFYGLWRLAAIGFVVGAGLYFGTRLRTTTAAVAATMGMFLCVTYLVAGPYNPIFPLFWRTIGSSLIRRGGSSAAFYAGLTIGPMFVVTAALGLDLLRRARRNVRLYVF